MDRDNDSLKREPARLRFPGTSPILLCLVAYVVLLAAAVSAEGPIRVTFRADQVGLFPSGWVSRNENPGRIYTVLTEGGKRFLHADARDASVQIGYEPPSCGRFLIGVGVPRGLLVGSF